MSYGLRPKSTYESIIKEVINPNLKGKVKVIDRTASNFYKSHEYTKLFNSDHIDLQNQLIDNQKEQMMTNAVNSTDGISYINQRVQEQAEREKEKKRQVLQQFSNVSSSRPVIHSMSTGQSDAEMDDADSGQSSEGMDVQDPSSSSTSLPKPKAKPLSKKSKEKAQREAEMAKARSEQTPNPYVDVITSETLHPKSTIKPKFDEVGRNTLTDKQAVLDYDHRKSYWWKHNLPYIQDQLLLRGYKFSEVGKMKTKGEMLKILHDIDLDDGI